MLQEERIENVLQKDIDILVTNILRALPRNPEAIFLCGGYGRGEGAWLEGPNGEPVPYNDFDIAIVTEYPLDSDGTNTLRKQLAAMVNIHWVDIDFYSHTQLTKLRNTIHDIDLLYASNCIYGDADILKKYGPLDASKIGHYDVVRLYKTRIWTLLGSWDGNFHDLSAEESIFFKNQMMKATLAACDFLLIKNHLYNTSYRERANLICQLYKENVLFCKRVKWAIKEKLRPESCEMSKEEMQTLYNECKNSFLWAASESFGNKWKYYGNPQKTLNHETAGIKKILIKIYLRLRHTPFSQKFVEVFAAQNYALLAEKEGVINQAYVKEASDILMKWGYINQPVTDWYVLHNLVADARNNI